MWQPNYDSQLGPVSTCVVQAVCVSVDRHNEKRATKEERNHCQAHKSFSGRKGPLSAEPTRRMIAGATVMQVL